MKKTLEVLDIKELYDFMAKFGEEFRKAVEQIINSLFQNW